MCPELVLTVSLLLLMISVLGSSLPMSFSCMPSVIFVPALNPLICWSGVSSSCLPLWYMFIYLPAVYGLNTLLCSTEFLSVNMSSKFSVPFTFCCLRYCSTILNAFQMCLVLHVISLPIFITLTMFGNPL